VSIDQTVLTATRTLAFLFTDVEGSTRLWERHPDAMRDALARHDRILSGAVIDARGHVVKTTGDGIMAVFETARDGVVACLAAQQGLNEVDWAETGPLRVRMGLHVGEGSGDGSDYHGPAVNRAARIMSAGHGGQILLSGPTAALIMDQLPAGTSLRDLGRISSRTSHGPNGSTSSSTHRCRRHSCPSRPPTSASAASQMNRPPSWAGRLSGPRSSSAWATLGSAFSR
jgi:class 3 adenylate cyclase